MACAVSHFVDQGSDKGSRILEHASQRQHDVVLALLVKRIVLYKLIYRAFTAPDQVICQFCKVRIQIILFQFWIILHLFRIVNIKKSHFWLFQFYLYRFLCPVLLLCFPFLLKDPFLTHHAVLPCFQVVSCFLHLLEGHPAGIRIAGFHPGHHQAQPVTAFIDGSGFRIVRVKCETVPGRAVIMVSFLHQPDDFLYKLFPAVHHLFKCCRHPLSSILHLQIHP